MEEVPGKAEDTVRYVYGGFTYHIDTTSIHLYRCSTRSSTRCRGAARVNEEGHVEVYTPHNCAEPNETILEELRMEREMLNLATETQTPLKQIFDAVCRRNPVVAPKLLFPRIRCAMQRARAKVRPNIPGSLSELGNALNTYAPAEAVYRGLVEGDDGSVALIFASDQMLEALGAATEIYVDGTFKGVAAVYALCGARTRALYSAIFERVIQLAPGIAQNLRMIMGDYERAAMSALRAAFPEASLHGCWFHFNQALVRRWRHLGLSGARTPILALAMSLPLAPSERFDEGLRLLAVLADAIAEEHEAILQFMRYMRTQWSPLAEVVSVHGCPSRTNNLVESFHNEARNKLGGLHPNVWKFIEHLLELIVNQGLDLTRLRAGQRARRPRTVRNMMADTVIRDAQHALAVDRYTLREFLDRCATRTAGIHGRMANVPEEDGPPQEMELVEPGVLAAANPGAHEPVQRGRGRRRGRGVQRPNRAGANPVRPVVQGANAQPAPVANPGLPPQVIRNVGEENGDLDDEALRGFEMIDGVRHDIEDIFHLPEDDYEVFAIPDDPVPYHPVEAIQHAEGAAGVDRPPGICCTCLVERATHALNPCGHRCCCAGCADEVVHAGRCPLCRTPIIGALGVRDI